MCDVRGSKQASVDLPNGGLDFPVYVEEFMGKAKDWNENSPCVLHSHGSSSV